MSGNILVRPLLVSSSSKKICLSMGCNHVVRRVKSLLLGTIKKKKLLIRSPRVEQKLAQYIGYKNTSVHCGPV